MKMYQFKLAKNRPILYAVATKNTAQVVLQDGKIMVVPLAVLIYMLPGCMGIAKFATTNEYDICVIQRENVQPFTQQEIDFIIKTLQKDNLKGGAICQKSDLN